MSGHSHWHGIRHKKAITDAKKASAFTKLAKDITLAAKEGGGDTGTNFRLRLAMDKARAANMPKDNIDRAIKRGTGELKGEADITEVVYEAMFPVSGGTVAMMIAATTDNRNRAVSEIKTLLKKNGGQMVANGSVGYLFTSIGIIELAEKQTLSTDDITLIAIDSGAMDIETNNNHITLYTEPKDLKSVENELVSKKIAIENSLLGYRPTQTLSLSDTDRETYTALLDILDEQEDVQTIFDNVA
jgi:YebC/PmpR family DNA-binding regulatory protein